MIDLLFLKEIKKVNVVNASLLKKMASILTTRVLSVDPAQQWKMSKNGHFF